MPALKASLPALEADELEDFRVSYAGTRFVESLAYVRSFPKTLPPLRDELHGIQTPTLIIYGKHDTAVLPGNADLLSRTLRNTQTIALDCGHFVWEEDADAYSVALLAWIGGGYRDALSPTGLTDKPPRAAGRAYSGVQNVVRTFAASQYLLRLTYLGRSQRGGTANVFAAALPCAHPSYGPFPWHVALELHDIGGGMVIICPDARNFVQT